MGQRQTKPDPDKTTLGILFPTSGAALLLLLYMSVFGQRMRYHGIRWHSINFSIWSLFQVFVFSDTAIKTPWPSYLNSKPIESNSQKLMIFLLSVYPAGCFFLFIEKIIHLSAPKLRENLHFHLIYWALTIVFINVILILSFFCEWWGVSPSGGSIWWYDPIDMCQIIFTTVIYIFVVIYLFICIGYAIGGVTCFRNSPTRSWSVTADMWLLLPYVLVPSLLVMTHFSFTASGLIITHFPQLVRTMMQYIEYMVDYIDMLKFILEMFEIYITMMPLVVCGLTILCHACYREQFVFMLSCGRLCAGTKNKIGDANSMESGGNLAKKQPIGLGPGDKGGTA